MRMKNHYARISRLFLLYAERSKHNFDELDLEHKNILAGISWAHQFAASMGVEGADESFVKEILIRYARSLLQGYEGNPGYLIVRGYWPEAKRLAEQTIEVSVSCGRLCM
jgi:hypothetical protein